MRNKFSLGFIGGFAAAAVICAGFLATSQVTEAQKSTSIKESAGGSVPKAWGDLVAVTGTKGSSTLVFKSTEDGTLRVVELSAQISTNCIKVTRGE